MVYEKIKKILRRGEGLEVEFKESLYKLNKNTFETICAFLNRAGGHLLLGINDSSDVKGVADKSVSKIINNIVVNANNPQKLNPPHYLSPEVVQYEGKKVIYCYIPESSQVHSTKGKIFDRNEDGDFDITGQTEQVRQLYLRKQTTYSENKIYPYIRFSDFNKALFPRVRNLAKNERLDHPWLEMNDEELMRSAGLYKKDYKTGEHGYTLAAVLLMGKDEVIQSVLPSYKTDAILRVENTDRYDDRDEVRTNLIESYDRLMAFARKHLPDKFYQEGEQRVSLRDRIFREIVANLLIHREFANAYPAKFIVEEGRVITENWNCPRGNGRINPAQFSPYPKNPTIAKFFKEIGRVEELGSGIRNTFKYTDIYSAAEPAFIEDDVFTTVVPLKGQVNSESGKVGRKQERLGKRLGKRLGENEQKILDLIAKDIHVTIPSLAESVGISTTSIENNIKKLKEKNLLERVGPARGGHWKINL